MKRQQVRQGDVFLEKSDSSIPKDAVKVKSENRRLILRRGEATGHHHSVDYRKAELYTLSDGSMLLKVNEETTLDHQEHAPLTLVPGIWIVPQEQVEYTPLEIRHVVD